MFKSIFKKLLVTYFAIIIAVIGALSLILTMFYSSYVYDEKNRSLVSAATKVNQLANSLSRNEISNDELNSALDSLGYVTDSKIYLVKMNKQSLDTSKALKLGEELDDGFLVSDLGKVLDGQTVFRRKQYSRGLDMDIVFTGVPWKTDTGMEGVILLFSPVSHITREIARINLAIWATAIFFIIVSAVVIYINSLKISKPIRQMEHAASRLAVGETTEDLQVKSRDEIGKLADTFNYMKQQLQNTEKMRKEFIANVSHDLRTPLTSINGFVEGMLDGVVQPEDYNKYLNIIHDETRRLTRLTGEILQLAKIQSGIMKLDRERLSVQDIVSSVIDSTCVLMEEKSLTLFADCAISVHVLADKDKLKQILINIVGNSVKYTDEKGSISINVYETPSATRFSIKDTGIGIPEDELPFIFEKFYRVNKTRHSSQGGAGLGLNIVKSLVELHGGRIWAYSKVGEGTEIVFEIPNYI